MSLTSSSWQSLGSPEEVEWALGVTKEHVLEAQRLQHTNLEIQTMIPLESSTTHVLSNDTQTQLLLMAGAF